MERPLISTYSDPSEFIKDMIRFRKVTERGFSVHRATKGLRRVSPALISLIIRKKRNLTVDRIDEISKLLNLNVTERFFFRQWIMADKNFIETPTKPRSRKDASTSILSDWINLYIKDLFLIPAVQKNPELVEKQMLGIASPKRI